MPAMDTLLFNDPEVKGLAFAILEECTDLQAFGRRMLELLANAAMSAKADEACNAPYGERDEGRVNSRNGYRERGLSTAAGDVTLNRMQRPARLRLRADRPPRKLVFLGGILRRNRRLRLFYRCAFLHHRQRRLSGEHAQIRPARKRKDGA